jgi:hypothetical protein
MRVGVDHDLAGKRAGEGNTGEHKVLKVMATAQQT